MTNAPRLVELTSLDRARRTNGLIGSRALLNELQFVVLIEMLVETQAVPRQAVVSMLTSLADRLLQPQNEYLTSMDENEYQAHRLRQRADALSGQEPRRTGSR